MANTYSTDLLPTTTGLDLGTSSQRWDLYAQNIDVSGSMVINSTVFNGIYFAGSTYSGATTIQAAVTAAGTTGTVIIPSTYTGTDVFTNTSNVPVMDLRLGSQSWQGFVSVKEYGAKGDGVTDDAPAIQACITANPGKTIIFPKTQPYNSATADYYCASSINVYGMGTVLDGLSGGNPSNTNQTSTRIKFASGISGFIIDNASAPNFGQGVTIRNLCLDGQEPWSVSDTSKWILPSGYGGTATSDGIRVYGHGFRGEGLTIRNFGRHGINIDTQNYSGNANCFYLANCRIVFCRGSGVHCQGGDSNAGTGILLDCTANQLWGIDDSSFLGNTWIGCHTDLNHEDQSTAATTSNISTSARVGNVVTLVTATNHGATVGGQIKVTGSSVSSFNGRFTVLTTPTAASLTYEITSATTTRVPTADSGTVQALTGSHTIWVPASVTGGPYNAPGAAQCGAWIGCYSEQSQPMSSFSQGNIVISGDHGSGIDYSAGGMSIRPSANGFHFSSHYGYLYDTFGEDVSITQTFKPGNTTDTSTVRIFQKYDQTELFRETVGTNQYLLRDVNSRAFVTWAPTASGFYSGGGEARIGSDAVLAKTSFRSNNVEVGSVSTVGKATFTGGLVLDNIAAPTAAANQVAFGSTVAATATNGTGEAMKANVEGYLIVNVAGVAVKIPYVKT